MAEAAAALQMQGIVKRFPGVLALGGVDFDLRPGEVHALLGENGAGKSTLMSVLAGLYRPDAGAILLDGERVRLRTPRDAIARGIGMVHQHFMLVPTQTVTENIFIGLPRPRFFLDLRRLDEEVAALGAQHGLAVDPRARLWQLSVGEQQRVEILKVLHRGARILVLDEPTAVLAPAEAEELGRTLRQLAARGRAIVFISHKLDEVRALADRVTVLRRGRVVAAGLGASSVEPAALARLMVGRDLEKPAPRRGGSPGAPVLAVEGLEALSDRGLPALRGVTLTVSRGEILGVAGVAGNGQRELCEVVTGLRGLRAGRVRLDGEDVTGAGPRELITRGVGHVPEDRAETGAAGGLSLAENLALKGYRVPPLKRGPWLDRAALRDRAARLIGEYDVQPPAVDAPAGALSGGNLQRLILAREIAAAPRLLVAAQPTRGLDVGATEAVHRLLQLLRDRGSAILLVSADLDEIRGLADRIIVLFEGRIAGEVAPDTNRATIGLLMAGGAAPAVAEA